MFQDVSVWAYLLSAFIGIGLAAASGFRVFMPMFALSLAAYMNWINLPENFLWLAGLPTLIATGIAMLVEILAYYIPFVDNILDSINVPLAAVAGTILFASQFAGMEAFPQWALALIAGGGTAATISAGFAGTRAASSTTTGGIGNSIVATTETAGAGILSAMSFLFPVLAAVAAVALVITVIVLGRKIWQKFKKYNTDETATPSL